MSLREEGHAVAEDVFEETSGRSRERERTLWTWDEASLRERRYSRPPTLREIADPVFCNARWQNKRSEKPCKTHFKEHTPHLQSVTPRWREFKFKSRRVVHRSDTTCPGSWLKTTRSWESETDEMRSREYDVGNDERRAGIKIKRVEMHEIVITWQWSLILEPRNETFELQEDDESMIRLC